jgi:hypothetical protein
MRGKSIRALTAAALVTVASLALPATSPATVTIGSDLGQLPTAGEGICLLSSAVEASRRCTNSQIALATSHEARGGLTAPSAGTIVRWSVRSGITSPSTAAVRLRLRLLDRDGEVGVSTPFVDLPPSAPGVHTFSTRLPVEKGDRLAIESAVKSKGTGPAYVPIAHLETGVGSLYEWTSPLFPGVDLAPDSIRDAELLLSAEIDTDLQPPRTKLTYPQRQDFLASKEVLVRFRCNEDATAFASGQLEFPNGKRASVIYGLYGITREVERGEKTALRLRLPRKTWEAAQRADENGKRIVVKVTVSATDAVGNQSGATVASIRPR